MAKIIAVCKSEEKGTRKKAVVKGTLKEDYSLVGDGRMDAYNQAGRIATDGK